MSDTFESDETEQEPQALADELGLGIELSPEEQAQAEEMVAHLRSQFSLDEEPVEEEHETEEAESPEEPEEEPEPEASEELVQEPVARHAPASDRIVIDGREYVVIDGVPYSVEQIRSQSQPQPEPAPQPPPQPQIPEWIDQDDPVQINLWRQTIEQQKRIDAIAANQQKIVVDQERERLTTEVQSGLSTFRQAHPELTEDDVQTIRLHATALNIVGGLAQTMDGPAAVRKALDIAYLDHPEYRAQHQGEPKPSEVKAKESSQRKAKLGALSGSSGSASRTPERPQKPSTDREMRAQATQWLSEQGIL